MFYWLFAVVLAGAATAPLASQEVSPEPLPNRPKVAGLLRLHHRERTEAAPGSKQFTVVERSEDWEVSQTAIIVVDMWDAEAKELVWRGVASDTISDNPQKNIQKINKAMAKMFERYPPAASSSD